jgi:hypothetical protein
LPEEVPPFCNLRRFGSLAFLLVSRIFARWRRNLRLLL